MKILDALRFVRGAVAGKELVPVLKHFRIKDGRIQAYNGVVQLSTPINCNLNIQPLATPFINAVQLCEDMISLHMTKTGKLAIKSGAFRAFIECSTENFPDIEPQGNSLALDGNLLPAMRHLEPLMGTDASRPWSRGILLANQSAFATNNIILAEHWLGFTLPATIGLPTICVNELLRINEEPEGLQSNGRLATFYFKDGRQLTSALLQIDKWPDPSNFFNTKAEPTDVDASFFDALEKLASFTDKFLKTVWLYENGAVSTSDDQESGARIYLDTLRCAVGRYSVDQLLKLKGLVDKVDWSTYPRPCQFFGPQLRGVIIGINK